jgi:hypothetical protein
MKTVCVNSNGKEEGRKKKEGRHKQGSYAHIGAA